MGADYYSVAAWGEQAIEVHQVLLKKNVVLLEGVDLTNVEKGRYQLIALPMKRVSSTRVDRLLTALRIFVLPGQERPVHGLERK